VTGVAFLFIVSSFLAASSCRAWPPTYGPEFEFGSKELQHYSITSVARILATGGNLPEVAIEGKMISRFRAQVAKLCPACKIEARAGKFIFLGIPSYRVTFEDGWWMEITADPWVVEILTKPMTLIEVQKNKHRIQTMIFDAAKSLSLEPNGSDSQFARAAGHLNIGTLSSFDGDGEAFLKFFVDHANHPELSAGVFLKDFYNAPPVSALSSEARGNLVNLVERQQARHRFKAPQEMAETILNDVYSKSYVLGGGAHYQALSIKKVPDASLVQDTPFEIRSMKMQQSAEDFALICELMEKRIEFVKNNPDPIVFANTNRIKFSRQELVDRYFIYIEEMGLDFNRFKGLMVPNLQSLHPSTFLTQPGSDLKRWIGFDQDLRLLQSSKWYRTHLLEKLKNAVPSDSNVIKKWYQRLAESLQNPDLAVSGRKVIYQTVRDTVTWPSSECAQAARGVQNFDEVLSGFQEILQDPRKWSAEIPPVKAPRPLTRWDCVTRTLRMMLGL